MKAYLVLSLFLLSFQALANISWQNLSVNSTYSSNMMIPLNQGERSFRIDQGSDLKLIEVEVLNMLKVYLHRYKVSDCPSPSLETDLELLLVHGKSVGINLVRNCVLEVYIENADHQAKSFLE